MAKIFEMPPHMADLIAAGEVVERPGSVVKELVENSIDAGALSVTVEIANGGMSMIRVTDDGCGIAYEDAERAFLRHATSKVREERDLEAIGTLGFRGEALAAISAVSRVELLTRERGAAEGTRLRLEGGVTVEKGPAGVPEGTTMIVRDLFYNTPARQKFMKNDRAEASNVSAAVVRLALSHPEVSIRYIRDGREEYHTPGDGLLRSCAYCTLGREFARELIEVKSAAEDICVSGLISTPAAARGNRAWQFFFINGRFVKSKLIQAALEQGYKNSLFTGRFPVCVLNLDMSLASVDVNVHPTKMEVRFTRERQVFDAVYWAVRGALEGEEGPAEITLSESTVRALGGAPARADAPRSGATGVKVSAPEDKKPNSPQGAFLSGKAGGGGKGGFFKTYSADEYRAKYAGGAEPRRETPPSKPRETRAVLHDSSGLIYETSMPMPIERPPTEEPPPPRDDFRYVGEALNTYLIAECGESIFLIDKHAAHERMLFDKLKAEDYVPESQELLAPVICRVSEETVSTIVENGELLRSLGFDIDDFGGGSVAIRRVPIDMDLRAPESLVEEIAGKLRLGADLQDRRDGVLHSAACKAAIKAGRRSDPREVQELIARVLSGEIRYCPHGRPVSVELSRRELDKIFKRT